MTLRGPFGLSTLIGDTYWLTVSEAAQPKVRPSRVGGLGFWLAVNILPSRDKREHRNG